MKKPEFKIWIRRRGGKPRLNTGGSPSAVEHWTGRWPIVSV